METGKIKGPMSEPSRKYSPETEVQFVKGIGPPLAKVLAKLGIQTIGDLLYYLPRRYEDRSNFLKIRDARAGEYVCVRGKIIDVNSKRTGGGLTLIRAVISDGTGTVSLVWFNQTWIKARLEKHNGEVIAYGQVQEGNWGYEIRAPEWETIDPDDDPENFARITPIYPLTEGVAQKSVRRAIRRGLAYLDVFDEYLPADLMRRYDLRSVRWALEQIHFPESEGAQASARRRLVFEEFLYLQIALGLRQREVGLKRGISFSATQAIVDELATVLPFSLTGAQKRVIDEIYRDMRREHPMSRLLQGDVGSGKTLVAAAAMLAAVRSGYQAALMAPTEILAEQHFSTMQSLLRALSVSSTLLVGRQSAAEKRKASQAVESGTASVVIGTHALIQTGVTFHKLGLAVVDEQHRFGVMQRAALREKGIENIDVLVMSATPIPRSLTLTIYGDLDLSVIDEMPPGRKPIKTHWKQPSDRAAVYEGVRKLLQDGAQAYVICPLVSESEKMLAQAAEQLYARMKDEVFPEFRVSLVHGQQKAKDRDEAMESFRRGDSDVLVSTTVIEVGVDVPNATVMLIEDANRFGLSQLHQLRGRVGRGSKQSFCILIASATTKDAEDRLRVMVETTDGFRIAEEDLRIRGPGDLYGTKQSGSFELRVADLLQDGRVLEEARQAAQTLLERDPTLAAAENAGIRAQAESQRARLSQTDVS